MESEPPDEPAPQLSRFQIWLGRLRLGAGVLLCVVGILPFVPSPGRLAWMLGIGVTEWGHWFALPALALLLPGWRRTAAAKLGALLGLIAAGLALSTIVRASFLSDDVARKVSESFPGIEPRAHENAPARSKPFHWIDAVLAIPTPFVEMKTVDYVTRGTQTLKMDVYSPPVTGAPAPGVLLIHGGAWRGGSRDELPALNRYLAARGYVVASIDYRLAPQSPFPAATDDIRAAIDYLKNHSLELGLDADRIALFGRSAGGHLALLSAYTIEENSIRGVVAVYPPTDLPYAHANPSNPRLLDSKQALEDFLGGSPASNPTAYQQASPVNFVKSQTVPTLLIHGAHDEFVYKIHSQKLCDKLSEHSVPHFLLEIPWGNHGCDANLSGPGGQLSLYATERFLASVLRVRRGE